MSDPVKEAVEKAATRLTEWLDDFDRNNADDHDNDDFEIGQDELIEVPAEALRAILAVQRPLLDRIAELEGERDEAREDARLRLAQKPYDEAYERVEPIIQTLVKAVIGDEEFAVQTAANEVLEAAFRNTFDRDWRSLFAARLAAEAQVSALQAQVDGLREAASWQDISTAPLDGTHILLAFGSDGVTLGWWDDREPGPYPWKFVDRGAPGSTGHAAGGFINGSREVRGGPTHWRFAPSGPLSQPPADEAAKGEEPALSQQGGLG